MQMQSPRRLGTPRKGRWVVTSSRLPWKTNLASRSFVGEVLLPSSGPVLPALYQPVWPETHKEGVKNRTGPDKPVDAGDDTLPETNAEIDEGNQPPDTPSSTHQSLTLALSNLLYRKYCIQSWFS